MNSATVRLTMPATAPFIAATWYGLLADTFCVRLLSMPQHRHAPAIASDPSGNTNPLLPCQEENHTSRDNQRHADSNATVEILLEQEPRDQGGEYPFQVEQERCCGCRRGVKPQHQQDRSQHTAEGNRPCQPGRIFASQSGFAPCPVGKI